MLDLHDPLWSELNTAFGTAEEVPELLASLLHEYDEEIFQELTEVLLHQYTVYTATVAAVPYLIHIAETSSLSVRMELYITCGMMVLGYAARATTIAKTLASEQWEPLQRAHTDALERMNTLHDSVLQYARTHIDDPSEQEYILAAWLAYGHHDTLAELILYHTGEQEYEGTCPACEQSFYAVVSDDGAMTLSPDDPVFAQNAKHNKIIPAELPSAGAWGALRYAAEQMNAKVLLQRLPSMTGTGTCPHCHATIAIADSLC
ncbi:hypothetical protein L2089_18500 [Paenibacillus hunanensis]|uniref:hypothetical protein n=1 Tax=Paenibacillus hunanensis TaxID=539262 RepID=UPI0020265F6F|nr:hypothetical protein [Paenibacillus hunanensis]MCL9662683.1 hypothetical protein [Paenibacillus hunanensis]